jgi:Tfp pilus assembly protein PilZ
MSRRRAVRRPRRVQVHFWKFGEPTPFVGHTTNISTTGMFVATNSPMPTGSRVRIEVIDRDRGFMVEGVVAHARKIRGELARVTQSGMGVRFLTVEELVRELIPAAVGTEEIPRNAPQGSDADSYGAEAVSPEPAPAPPLPSPLREPVRSPSPPPAAAPPRPVPLQQHTGEGTFSVRFASAQEFLQVYQRDIIQGGLFVSTLQPARIQETVVVEIHPPIAGAQPVLIRARVVQRFEPRGDGNRPNLLAGMGLELIDLPTVVERLQPVVRQLQAQSFS